MQMRLTDQEFAAKKVVDDHLGEAKSENITALLEEQRELKRSNIVANELKSQKEDLEHQSNAAMMEFVHQKEENIAYRLKLQEDDHLVKVSLE
jgi:hypothetical protein